MSHADDLLHEAHGLAEKIQRRRATPQAHSPRDGEGLPAMETRLARLWTEIRAARAAPAADSSPPAYRRPGPKWG